MTDTIKTPRLELRAPTVSDVRALTLALNNYEITKWLAKVPNPYTEADAIEFIERNMGKAMPNYSIFEDGTLIGGVGLAGLVGLGYWFVPSAWGKGYATEVCHALLARHFSDPDAEDVLSGYIADNAGSANVQRKLGFRIIGQSKFTTVIRGEVDHVDTVISRADWLAHHGLPLRVDDLVLRPMSHADAGELQRIAGNDDVAPMCGSIHSPWHDDDVHAWIEKRLFMADGRWNLLIEDAGDVVGYVGVGGDPLSIAYLVAKPKWGQGIVRRGVHAMLTHAFANMDADQIGATCFVDNPASIAVLERFGFEKCGEEMGSSAARLEPAPVVLYRLTRTKFESLL